MNKKTLLFLSFLFCLAFGLQAQDIDGDGVLDVGDNCVFTFNPGQADTNGDGIGDLCDNDGDGILKLIVLFMLFN